MDKHRIKPDCRPFQLVCLSVCLWLSVCDCLSVWLSVCVCVCDSVADCLFVILFMSMLASHIFTLFYTTHVLNFHEIAPFGSWERMRPEKFSIKNFNLSWRWLQFIFVFNVESSKYGISFQFVAKTSFLSCSFCFGRKWWAVLAKLTVNAQCKLHEHYTVFQKNMWPHLRR